MRWSKLASHSRHKTTQLPDICTTQKLRGSNSGNAVERGAGRSKKAARESGLFGFKSQERSELDAHAGCEDADVLGCNRSWPLRISVRAVVTIASIEFEVSRVHVLNNAETPEVQVIAFAAAVPTSCRQLGQNESEPEDIASCAVFAIKVVLPTPNQFFEIPASDVR